MHGSSLRNYTVLVPFLLKEFGFFSVVSGRGFAAKHLQTFVKARSLKYAHEPARG
jgi:hypothetical protein